MMYPIDTCTWKILRAIKRGGGTLPTSEIRKQVSPNRRTKSGAFFEDLVKKGLIENGGAPLTPETSKFTKDPIPFRTTYILTVAGEYAAEYGEYDADPDNGWRAVGSVSTPQRSKKHESMGRLFAGKGPPMRQGRTSFD